MSEVRRKLKQDYREIGSLFSDLESLVNSGQNWNESVFARRSLGSDVQVELWYLAEHFLLAWNDLRGLCERYLRYFGQQDAKLPKTWRDLGKRCRKLADRIVQDRELYEIIKEKWLPSNGPSILAGEEEESPRSLFHALVMNHRRLTLVLLLDSQPNRSELSDTALDLNRGLINQWQELPTSLREETIWYLRNYQRSNLMVSWLMEETTPDINNSRKRSLFLHALTSENKMNPSIELFVNNLEIEVGEKETVRRVLQRVESAINQLGYENFLEDLSSPEFFGGNNSPVGSDAINLIPGHGSGICCTTLLAVSKGDNKAIGFPSIMRKVREHLIKCINKTRVVIILCDHWRPAMLEDHILDLRAHHDRGTRFLFLMVGTPGRVVAPVAVDLEITP